ncbi:MAG: hypothetical protein J7L19_02405 [Dehalococcoidia bacterium]|nr:hypothetical protein [Dehalococcoidia bacterium]
MRSFGELSNEQAQRENDALSYLVDASQIGKPADLEAELGERRSEILFKVITDMEDTENALIEVGQLEQRLKKHLAQLKDLQRVLSK